MATTMDARDRSLKTRLGERIGQYPRTVTPHHANVDSGPRKTRFVQPTEAVPRGSMARPWAIVWLGSPPRD